MKKKLFAVLMSMVLCFGMTSTVFAEEATHGSETSTVTLKGERATTSKQDTTNSDVTIIGYKISWNNMTNIKVTETTKYQKIWNPATLTYINNTSNESASVKEYKLTHDIPTVATITNLSNAKVKVQCSFSLASAFENSGYAPDIADKTLTAASVDTEGGKTDLSISNDFAITGDVAKAIFDGMSASGQNTIGTYTITVTAVE